MNAFKNHHLKVMVLRPGSTDLDEQGRITGSLDVPLSGPGRQQVQQRALEMPAVTVDRIYSAPGSAAQQTLRELPQFNSLKVRVEESLSNVNHGLWHGKCIVELQQNQPKLFRQWQENPELIHLPGGESIEDVRVRVTRLIRQIERKQKSGKVLIVAPEPVASIILSELEGTELQTYWQTHGRFAEWTWVRCKRDELAFAR
ncbi:MAG: histidine phosphatase family protein [Planctomycetota bacterium]|nr:histidine phosphatase family protein [Planctomycetota bacterium]